MSESKKVDHWAFLASELGATSPEPEEQESFESPRFMEETQAVSEPAPEPVLPAPEEIRFEEIVVSEPVAEEPAATEPPPVRPKRSRSSWDMLADELGIEATSEPEPEVEPEPFSPMPVAESAMSPEEPAIDRQAAERMFESLFTSREPAAEIPPQAFALPEPPPAPQRDERPYTPKREESRESRRPPKREEARHGGKRDRPRRDDRDEESRRPPKTEPEVLFLDEDIEADEREAAFGPKAESPAPEEDKKSHRHRRRGRRDREPEKRPPEKPAFDEMDILPVEDEGDDFSFFDEPLEVPPRAAARPQFDKEDEEEEEEERPSKSRRSRRGSRKPKRPPEVAEEKAPAGKTYATAREEDDLWDDEDEDLEPRSSGSSRRGGPAKGPQSRDSDDIRPAFRSIPTWDETIGLLVNKNMESRGRGGQNRGRGQTQNRGGRRDNRR
jgi:hypothetical protein